MATVLFFLFLIAAAVAIARLRGQQPPESPPPDRRTWQPEPEAQQAHPPVHPTGPRPPLNRDHRFGRQTPVTVHAPRQMEIRGRAWVIDGDTIKIGQTKIRLAGIDAPELDDPYGQQSKWAMVAICKGQEIRAELTGERSYDRFVATCYLPDGSDIGAELIRRGLALDGGWYSKGKYRSLEPQGIRWKLRHAYKRKQKAGG